MSLYLPQANLMLNNVQVLDHLHQYVPSTSVEVPVDAPGGASVIATDDSFHHILFGMCCLAAGLA